MSNMSRNLIIVTAFLAALGFIADIVGVFGIDTESKITTKWLLLETIIMVGAIVSLIQFIRDMRKKLDAVNIDSSELIKQLLAEKDALNEQLKSVIYERELLQSAIQVIESDERRLTDPEIAYLSAISSGMSSGRETLSENDKYGIVKGIIKLSCSDRDFRDEQKIAVRDLGEKYNLPDAVIIGLIGEQEGKMKRASPCDAAKK